MRNSEASKLQKTVRLVGFLAVLLMINSITGVFAVSPTEEHRFQDGELYTNRGLYDVIAMGPSDCRNGFDPKVADEILGKRTFNYGQEGTGYSSGAVEAGFRNALAVQDPDTIIFFVPEGELTDEVTQSIEPSEAYCHATDGMSSRRAKIRYYFKASARGRAIERFFRVRVPKNFNQVRHFDELASIVKLKTQSGYMKKDPAWHNEVKPDLPFAGSGYLPRPVWGNDFGSDTFEVDLSAGQDAVQIPAADVNGYDLEKMLQYCTKNGIRAVVVVGPLYVGEIAKLGNEYLAHCGMIETVAKRNNAEFYNMNMVKKEIFRPRTANWADEAHLNEEGAKGLTQSLCDIMNTAEAGGDTGRYFYKTMEEYFSSFENVTLIR